MCNSCNEISTLYIHSFCLFQGVISSVSSIFFMKFHHPPSVLAKKLTEKAVKLVSQAQSQCENPNDYCLAYLWRTISGLMSRRLCPDDENEQMAQKRLSVLVEEILDDAEIKEIETPLDYVSTGRHLLTQTKLNMRYNHLPSPCEQQCVSLYQMLQLHDELTYDDLTTKMDQMDHCSIMKVFAVIISDKFDGHFDKTVNFVCQNIRNWNEMYNIFSTLSLEVIQNFETERKQKTKFLDEEKEFRKENISNLISSKFIETLYPHLQVPFKTLVMFHKNMEIPTKMLTQSLVNALSCTQLKDEHLSLFDHCQYDKYKQLSIICFTFSFLCCNNLNSGNCPESIYDNVISVLTSFTSIKMKKQVAKKILYPRYFAFVSSQPSVSPPAEVNTQSPEKESTDEEFFNELIKFEPSVPEPQPQPQMIHSPPIIYYDQGYQPFQIIETIPHLPVSSTAAAPYPVPVVQQLAPPAPGVQHPAEPAAVPQQPVHTVPVLQQSTAPVITTQQSGHSVHVPVPVPVMQHPAPHVTVTQVPHHPPPAVFSTPGTLQPPVFTLPDFSKPPPVTPHHIMAHPSSVSTLSRPSPLMDIGNQTSGSLRDHRPLSGPQKRKNTKFGKGTKNHKKKFKPNGNEKIQYNNKKQY